MSRRIPTPLHPGSIKRVRHELQGEYCRHLLRLTPYQRRMRFNSGVSNEFIRSYCRGFRIVRPVILGCFVDGRLKGAGELLVLVDAGARRSCEVALSVEEMYQGRGIGTALAGRLLMLASNRSIRTMHIMYTPENKRMDNIARRIGATIQRDNQQVSAVVPVPPASDLSLFAEAMTEGARRVSGGLDRAQRTALV